MDILGNLAWKVPVQSKAIFWSMQSNLCSLVFVLLVTLIFASVHHYVAAM